MTPTRDLRAAAADPGAYRRLLRIDTPPPERLRQYAADPMVYFANAIIPAASGNVRLGDCWAPFQQEAFGVLARCLLAVATGEKSPYRGVWLERTKGASKDSDIGLALTWLLLFSPRPQLVELGADDFEQVIETRKAMQADLRLNPWKAGRLTVMTNRIRNESTGSEAVFRTRDASGSHGSRPSVTVCNELSHCQSEEFILTLVDNAAKNPRGLVIIATNAGTLRSWQHRWRENSQADPVWWFQAVHYPAPWIGEENIRQAARRNPPSRFRRLFWGEWSSGTGDALSAELIERATVLPGPAWQRGDPREYPIAGIGLDLGLTTRHAAAVAVTGSHRTRTLEVAAVLDFPPPVSLRRVEAAVVELGQRFRTGFLAMDPRQGQGLAESLTARGFAVQTVHPTPQNQVKQAAGLLQAFQDGVLRLYPDALLLEDLHNARLVETHYGTRLQFAENANGHGDRLAALVMILPFVLEALGAGPPPNAAPGTVVLGPGVPVPLPDEVVTAGDLHRLLRMKDEYEARLNALTGGF